MTRTVRVTMTASKVHPAVTGTAIDDRPLPAPRVWHTACAWLVATNDHGSGHQK